MRIVRALLLSVLTGFAILHPSLLPGLQQQAMAQSDGDDAYDPFADYSEFEESMEEEEDLNFFRNGRMLTMGFLGGYRGFTGQLGNVYSGAPMFGLYLCYFFDLRFAVQMSFLTSDSSLYVKTANTDPVSGTVSLGDISFLMKYYLNTQNVTRGLADLNPYLVGGFSQLYRTSTVSGTDAFGRDSSPGFNLGVGIEIPMLRNKMYFGGQVMFQYAAFPDEAKTVRDGNDVDTGVRLQGDSYHALGILGINF